MTLAGGQIFGTCNLHMWTLFQSTRVAPADRFAAWNKAVERAVGRFQTHCGVPAEQFRAEIEARRIGGLECLRIVQGSNTVRRSVREIREGENDRYCLVLQVRGFSWMSQDSREASLRPCELTLLDSALPSTFRFGSDNVQLVLRLPRSLVCERLPAGGLPVATTLSGGAASVAGRLLEAAYEQAAECSPEESAAIRDSLLGLVFGNVLARRDEPAAAHDAHPLASLHSVREYITRNLADPSLCPARIAAAHGISVRHLHRIFSVTGRTVGTWIREERLRRCAADLRNHSLGVMNLTAIAHHWGFSDSATFSRTFKTQFGSAPSQYRSRFSPRPPATAKD